MTDAWCGAHEIAKMLGVTRQRAHQLMHLPDFPEPAIRLQMGQVWRTRDIRAWAKKHGRKLNE